MPLELPAIVSSDRTQASRRHTHSFDAAYANPFKISEESLSDVQLNAKASVSESKKVLSRSERLHTILGIDDCAIAATSTAIGIIPLRRADKEDMTDFIAKKREMFLVQMSLDTKRDEIRKLEEKAQKQEKALLASEEKLKKDADEFELFLKKNDSNAQEAIRRAEEETAKKQKKTQDIKVLTQQIQTLSSEMSKQRELLKTCVEYREFLDALTPPEWFESFEKQRREQQESLRREAFQTRHRDWELLRRKVVDAHRREQDAKKDSRRDRGRRAAEDEDVDETENKLVIPPAPRLEDEPRVELPPEEPPMYFRDPQQLMELFSALEEQNLFLIQNSQDTEMTLEELRHKFMQTTEDMNARTGQLEGQILELRTQIASEVAFAVSLKARRQAEVVVGAAATATGGAQEKEKEQLLHELNAKVRSVYESCGFDGSSRPSTLIMLSQLESELEAMLSAIERMPIEYVKNQEKEKEKGRREKKRVEQQLLQEKLQDERNRRAIERSLQAPKKRTGKPNMFRSRLARREVNRDDGADLNKDNDDEIRHLS